MYRVQFLKSWMYLSHCNQFKSLRCIHQLKKNYYDILKVKPDCSSIDIRHAFISLSKVYHPDMLKASKIEISKEKNLVYINILEAYQVLGKQNSRDLYDSYLKGDVTFVDKDIMHEPWNINPDTYSQKSPQYGPYYGIKGLKKFSNWKIVIACAVFALVGIFCQYIAISHSVTFKREQLDQHSSEISTNHAKVREEAEKYGNSEQLNRMKNRLKSSIWDNPK